MRRTTKQVIAFFLTLVLLLSLCACGQKPQTGTVGPDVSAGEETRPDSGVYSWGLEGCWTTQAAAWDTGCTANYYLWFFPEDENGGSVDLDWQYEGSDLFEEMWSGYWEITSVVDGPSYVTISLSLVGGENYGVTDGPYYISETYPLLISPSGEEMVLGAGENGVSLPFMPQEDPQPCTLTLDSWFTESPDW